MQKDKRYFGHRISEMETTSIHGYLNDGTKIRIPAHHLIQALKDYTWNGRNNQWGSIDFTDPIKAKGVE